MGQFGFANCPTVPLPNISLLQPLSHCTARGPNANPGNLPSIEIIGALHQTMPVDRYCKLSTIGVSGKIGLTGKTSKADTFARIGRPQLVSVVCVSSNSFYVIDNARRIAALLF